MSQVQQARQVLKAVESNLDRIVKGLVQNCVVEAVDKSGNRAGFMIKQDENVYSPVYRTMAEATAAIRKFVSDEISKAKRDMEPDVTQSFVNQGTSGDLNLAEINADPTLSEDMDSEWPQGPAPTDREKKNIARMRAARKRDERRGH